MLLKSIANLAVLFFCEKKGNDMPWKNILKKKRSHTQSEKPFVGFQTLTGPNFSSTSYSSLAREGYMQNVIVYRCINLIARSAASVPWLLYQQNKISDDQVEIEQHPIISLLKNPNPNTAKAAFIEKIVSQLMLSGNCYIKSVRDNCGNIRELFTLRPDRVSILPGKHGDIAGYSYAIENTKQVYEVEPEKPSPVLHLKFYHPLDDWYGLSPIEAAAKSIDQHNAVSGHNLSLLQNGGRPSGAFVIKPNAHSSPLSEKQRQEMRHDIQRLYQGSDNAGKIMVLEGDFEWRDMGLSPKDLDFYEGKLLSSREICQAFGVPPMLAGVPGDATFANYKEARYHLWEDTIIPLLEMVQAEINSWLCPQFDENLRLSFDLDHIPALAPRREATWSKISEVNFLTEDEKRQALGYGPKKK